MKETIHLPVTEKLAMRFQIIPILGYREWQICAQIVQATDAVAEYRARRSQGKGCQALEGQCGSAVPDTLHDDARTVDADPVDEAVFIVTAGRGAGWAAPDIATSGHE